MSKKSCQILVSAESCLYRAAYFPTQKGTLTQRGTMCRHSTPPPQRNSLHAHIYSFQHLCIQEKEIFSVHLHILWSFGKISLNKRWSASKTEPSVYFSQSKSSAECPIQGCFNSYLPTENRNTCSCLLICLLGILDRTLDFSHLSEFL